MWSTAILRLLSFIRQNERDKVFAVFNLSDQPLVAGFHESSSWVLYGLCYRRPG